MSTTVERPDPTPAGLSTPAPGGDPFVAGAAGSVVLVLVAVQVLAGELIPPLAVFAIVYLVLALAVARRRSRWLLAIVMALAAVHLLGSVPFFAANLAHPESPGSFLVEVAVLLTVTVTLVGAIGGMRREAPRSRRPLVAGAAALGALAVVVSLIAAAGVDADARQPGDVVVEAMGSTYPARLQLPAGESVLWIDNQDPFHHTLVIEGTDVRTVLPASTSVRTAIELAPGSYRYLCDVPGHEAMGGGIDVR
jgi:plastocyanin